MPKRAAKADDGAAASPAKAARSSSAGRKRAPKVVYAEAAEVRMIEPAASMEAYAEALPPRAADHDTATFKVMCWNVASLRALVRKGDGFRQWALAEMPDVLVLNEHKLDESLVMPHGAAPAEVADGPAAGGKAKKPMARQASLDGMLGKTAAAGRGEDAAAGSGGPAPATASASAPASTKPKGRKPAKAAERFNAASLFGGGVFAHETWACTTSKKGYAGVVAFSRTAPLASSTGLGDPELDSEGRVVTLEWPGLAVVGCYTPNSGMKLDRLAFRTERWDPAFRAHLLALERRRGRVLVVGDLNAALRDFDVYDPKRMRDKQAGFCDAERASLAALLAPRGVMYAPATQEAADGDDAAAAGDAPPPASAPAAAMTGITQSAPGCGFVDTWLAASEANAACSQWSFFSMRFGMRPKNKGWRLDYGLASEALAARVTDSYIRGSMVGSDHLPIGVELERAVLDEAPRA